MVNIELTDIKYVGIIFVGMKLSHGLRQNRLKADDFCD